MSTNSPFKLSASDETNRLAEIYRAAASLICEKGYDATSMNDIAEAVGLTKAGIYHHIEGKKDLLFRIMNFGMDELDENVIIPARAIADAESRLQVEMALRPVMETTFGVRSRVGDAIVCEMDERAQSGDDMRGGIEVAALFRILTTCRYFARQPGPFTHPIQRVVDRDLRCLDFPSCTRQAGKDLVRLFQLLDPALPPAADLQ